MAVSLLLGASAAFSTPPSLAPYTTVAPRAQPSMMAQSVVGRRAALLAVAALPALGAQASIEEIAARANAAAEASKAKGGDPKASGFEPPPTAIAKALLGDTVQQAEDRKKADEAKKAAAFKKQVLRARSTLLLLPYCLPRAPVAAC